MEGSEQGLGHTRQYGPPRSNKFSGSCGTVGNLGQLDQRAEAPDKPAEGWRQFGWDNCHRFVGKESQQDHGRDQKVKKFIAEDNHEAVKVGDLHWKQGQRKCRTKVHGRFPGSCFPGRCG